MILLRCSEMFHVTYMLRDVTYMLRTCYVRLKSSILRGFVRLFGTRVVRVRSVHAYLSVATQRSRVDAGGRNDPLYATPTAGSGQSILPLGTL